MPTDPYLPLSLRAEINGLIEYLSQNEPDVFMALCVNQDLLNLIDQGSEAELINCLRGIFPFNCPQAPFVRIPASALLNPSVYNQEVVAKVWRTNPKLRCIPKNPSPRQP